MKRRQSKPRMSIADVLATKHMTRAETWDEVKGLVVQEARQLAEESDASREFREQQLAKLDKAAPFLDELHKIERAAGTASGWPPSAVLMTGFFTLATLDPHKASEHPFVLAGGYLHRNLERARAHHRAGMYADPFREVMRP